MVQEVIMPMLGMAQDTGKLLKWLKNPGDEVAVGDILFEVETDKSVSEVEAQADGFLCDVQAIEGADIPVGQIIAIISDSPEEGGASHPTVFESGPETAPEPKKEVALEPSALAKKPERDGALSEVEGGRILASPKARRLAAEAGLDLSRLVGAGVPQPYHVADLERLKALPVAPQGIGGVSHIGAVVPTTGVDAFIAQMRDEGGVTLTFGIVVLAFAAAGLRKTTEAETLTLSMEDIDAGRLVFTDPDRLRLSAIAGAGAASKAISHMDLRDAGEGYLTTIALGQVAQPTLCIARVQGTFHLTLSFPEEYLTPEQAIETMHELTARLAEPMLALV